MVAWFAAWSASGAAGACIGVTGVVGAVVDGGAVVVFSTTEILNPFLISNISFFSLSGRRSMAGYTSRTISSERGLE